MCREQRCQDTCVKVLNDSPGQGWGQDFIQEVLQKQVRDCKKNLTLNPKDCREECLPISFACVLSNAGSEPPWLV